MSSSLKWNIAANYASQIYTALIGIVLVPLYIQKLGSEAYGLVGFFAMLQAWFNLLDLGLTPTIARESACYHGGSMSAVAYRRLYRSLSVIFVGIAAIGGAALFALADAVAGRWLNVRSLPPADVLAAVQIMGVCVALRWMGGLYRGVVLGSERLVWLSGFNAVIATLRFVGVFGTMLIWGFAPVVFFWHQLAVAALEVFVLLTMCHRLLPCSSAVKERIGWSFAPIRPLVRFSITIAFTSSVWVLVTQTDKLILSGILPLSEYGYFTLAVLVSSGITIISGPISMAIMPRMARLYAEGKHNEVRHIYNQATQLVSVIAGSLAVTLIVCAEPLLFAWSGSREVTEAASPILRLYAIGNGLLALGAFPYFLQYARGDLRYHLTGSLLLAVLLGPAIVVAAMMAGGIGAGWVWVSMNALYLTFWVGYVHSKLEPGLHCKWLVSNVLSIVLPTLLLGLLLSGFRSDLHHSRLLDLAQTTTTLCMCLLMAIMCSGIVRPVVLRAVRARTS